jgi:hypothetical protein
MHLPLFLSLEPFIGHQERFSRLQHLLEGYRWFLFYIWVSKLYHVLRLKFNLHQIKTHKKIVLLDLLNEKKIL